MRKKKYTTNGDCAVNSREHSNWKVLHNIRVLIRAKNNDYLVIRVPLTLPHCFINRFVTSNKRYIHHRFYDKHNCCFLEKKRASHKTHSIFDVIDIRWQNGYELRWRIKMNKWWNSQQPTSYQRLMGNQAYFPGIYNCTFLCQIVVCQFAPGISVSIWT